MCGIYGVLNTKPKKFDYPTFCTLGIANDSRGGDSCGIFIDGEIEYGTGTEKYFYNHFTASQLLKRKRGTKIQIALGHDRKASVGGISEATAQPVVLKGKGGDVRYVMIHNGTIHNYEDLAKKYIPEVDIKGLTDSQVLARIFYYKGYDCLSEYYGGAAFVAVDYRQPQPLIVMWRGASKKNKWAKDPEEERPLWFIYNKDRGELVFSSLSVWLEALRPGDKLYHPVANTLIRYNLDDGEVYVHKQYSRDEVYQSKKDTGTTTYGSYYGGDYEGMFSGGYSSKWKNETVYSSKYLEEDLKSNTYKIRSSTEILHGKYRISKYGRIYGTGERSTTSYESHEVYFFAGIALKNKKYFKFLEYLKKRAKLSPKEFLEKHTNLVRYFSIDRLYFKDGKLRKATTVDKSELFTGKYQPLGHMWSYEYKDGEPVKEESGLMKKTSGDYETPLNALNIVDDIVISKIHSLCKSLMR